MGDFEKLKSHGDSEVQLIADHFQPALPPLDGVVEQLVRSNHQILTEIRAGTLGSPGLLLLGGGGCKKNTGEMLSQFLGVWEAVLQVHTTAYPQACLVSRISLGLMDCRDVVESG